MHHKISFEAESETNNNTSPLNKMMKMMKY